MKAKKLMVLVVVLGILVSASAIPALAEDGDAIDMWIQRVRLAYTGRSPHGPDAYKAYVHVRDATLDMVEGATVTATWTLPDSSTLTQTAVSNEQGIAIFSVWYGRGTYSLCVEDATKDGWLYNPDLNWETCDTLTPAP